MNIDKYYNISNPDIFPLILSKKFVRVLKSIDNNISKELLRLSKNKEKFKETFIDISEKEDMISFISSDKVNKFIKDKVKDVESECWTNPQRIETRIGRLIFRLIGDRVQGSEIEDFVNEYKSIISAKKLNRNFKIIQGEELRKWYLFENYTEGGGNLRNSCMKHRFCQSFFDLYVHNPDKIKMLILLDETKEKILGRALIWKLDRPEDKIFMDRVYFSNDFILNMFINYAIKHKWLYKLESREFEWNNVLQVISNYTIKNETMIVKIKKEDHEFYPFVDNLCFYDPISATLSNNPKYLKSIGCEEYYDLCEHTGGYEIRRDFDF
jgi:hypothetical protein